MSINAARATFDLARPALVAALCCGLFSLGCSRTQPKKTVVTPSDLRIAKEVSEEVEAKLAALNDNDPIIRRHGKFVSLETGKVTRHASFQAFDVRSPAHLLVPTVCKFENYTTTSNIAIYAARGRREISFGLEPSAAFIEGNPGTWRPEQVGDSLVFVDDSQQARATSTLSVHVTHPGFSP